MARIRFLADACWETNGPNNGPRFKAGQIVDASDLQKALGLDARPSPAWAAAHLERWINRGLAVPHEGAISTKVLDLEPAPEPQAEPVAPVDEPEAIAPAETEDAAPEPPAAEETPKRRGRPPKNHRWG